MLCEYGSCCEKATAKVRFCNALGWPTAESYWFCEHHAKAVTENCPRGDFVEERK